MIAKNPFIVSANLNIVTSHIQGAPEIAALCSVYIGAIGIFTFNVAVMLDSSAWDMRTDTFAIDPSLFQTILYNNIHVQFYAWHSMFGSDGTIADEFRIYYTWIEVTWSNGQVTISRPTEYNVVLGTTGSIIDPQFAIDRGPDAAGGNASTYASLYNTHFSSLAFYPVLQIVDWHYPPVVSPSPAQTFDADDNYFSGQGVVMVSKRDIATGMPTGFQSIGNVSSLKISSATTVIDHQFSQDGLRSMDTRLQSNVKVTVEFVLDNWISANIAAALGGAASTIVSGSVVDEAFFATLGMVSCFKYINISDIDIVINKTNMFPYQDDFTAYDYKVNYQAGSVKFNDGKILTAPPVNLGVLVTSITLGSPTILELANTAVPGDSITLLGFGGVDAGFLNGQVAIVIASDGLTLQFEADTTGLDIVVVATTQVLFLNKTLSLLANYSYSSQYKVDPFLKPPVDVWLRFEGLNTVDSNKPVIVDVFKFQMDPLKELLLISDTFSEMMLEGEVLKDLLRPKGESQHYSVKMLH